MSEEGKLSLGRKQQLKPSQFSLKPADVRKIVNAASTFRDRCLIRLLADTGMRRSEVVALDVRDLDFDRERVTVRAGKGGKTRIVPISAELASDLRHLVGKTTTGPLFVSRLRAAMQPLEVNRIVARAAELGGVKHPDPKHRQINPHIFRHTFSHQWKKRGGNLEALQHIVGHASIATTIDMYGRLSVDDVQEEYRRMTEKQETLL